MNIQAQFETYRATVLSAFSANENIIAPALAYALQHRIYPFWHQDAAVPFKDCFKENKETVKSVLDKIEKLDGKVNVDRHALREDLEGDVLTILNYVRLSNMYDSFFQSYIGSTVENFNSSDVAIY